MSQQNGDVEMEDDMAGGAEQNGTENEDFLKEEQRLRLVRRWSPSFTYVVHQLMRITATELYDNSCFVRLRQRGSHIRQRAAICHHEEVRH